MPTTGDNGPLLSVIVPSFNQGNFIRETIASCLSQDYRPIEILVRDGASTDETLAVLQNLRCPELVVVSEPDGGVTDAVNKGLASAHGEILTIQSSDDLFLPGAFSAAIAAFADRPRSELIYGDVELIDSRSNLIGEDIQGEFSLAEYLARLMYIPQPGAFFRREAFARVGGWRAEVSYCADADFWIRIALGGPVLKLDRKLAQYRYHEAQRDSYSERIERDWTTMARELLSKEALDENLRRAVRMGLHLARYRYSPKGAYWRRTLSVYAAALANPSRIAHRNFPTRELIPFRGAILMSLSRVKQWLLATARLLLGKGTTS